MAEKDAGAEEITLPAFTFEDGKIDVTQASGPDFTDQIVTPPGDEEIAAYLRKVELAIKESKFGTVDVQDFKDFSTTGAPVQEGEYLFRVESAHLKLATSVLDGIVARSSQAATTVTLFSDRAKFAAFIYPTFAEILLKTTAPITNVPAGHGAEGFDVSPDGKELWAANAQDGNITIIARNFGVTRKCTGLIAMVSSASISSVTFMVPISAANAEPERPITTMAVIKGPSSRVIETATAVATRFIAPNFRSSYAACKARINPIKNVISERMGSARTPSCAACDIAVCKRECFPLNGPTNAK